MRDVRQWLERENHLRGAAAFRILAGTMILYQMLISYAQRDFVYHSSVFINTAGTQSYSLLGLLASFWWFDVAYHAGLGIGLAWTLGYALRITTPLMWWLVYSLSQANPYIHDGGDNLIAILLAYATFMNLSGRPAFVPFVPQWLAKLAHNTGVCACRLQVAIVYCVAGLSKLSGEHWPNGTAIYYVFASDRFGSPWAAELVSDYLPLLLFGTWVPVVLQLSFPWLYFFGNPNVRRCVVGAAVLFHAGIAVTMDLISFAGFMIAAELLLLSDQDYRWISSYVARFAGLLWQKGRKAIPA